MTDPKGQSDYVINGQLMSGWKVRRRYKTRGLSKLKLIDSNVVRIPLKPKYRDVYPAVRDIIRPRVVADFASVTMPYPKREEEGVAPMDVRALCKVRMM